MVSLLYGYKKQVSFDSHNANGFEIHKSLTIVRVMRHG